LKLLHIGFDDTDSLEGSCTTHLATTIVTEIFDQVTFIDMPNLIRLNPNIPYKTRGNGAVALRVKGEKQDLENCREIVIKFTEKLARIEDENTNPGIVFLEGDLPSKIKAFSERAMWDVLTIKEAEKFSNYNNIDLVKMGNGRGIIGGFGAIGNPLENDFTYEHLTYRKEENYGTKRLINNESVIQADKATPLTFNNVDYEYQAIMITPRGADPVYSGIRGETIDEIKKAWDLIEPLEPIVMKMIFRTNQHTNEHFAKRFKIKELRPHISAVIQGSVAKKPYYIEGSHLIFAIQDESGKIDCAAYEPTKRFRKQLNELAIDDEVTIFGGLRPPSDKHPLTINIEQLLVNNLIGIYKSENPFCDKCGARLKSAGKNKGYKCFKCSAIYRDKKPHKTTVERNIETKKYLPPIIAHRHLTKPTSRDQKDNTSTKPTEKIVSQQLTHLVRYNRSENIKPEN
jgi:tRNA(Ile2)-agmatinylcytidine synthase